MKKRLSYLPRQRPKHVLSRMISRTRLNEKEWYTSELRFGRYGFSSLKKYDALEMALFIIDMGTTEHCRLITQYDLNLRVMFRYSPRATRPPLWPPDLPFAPSVSGAGCVARWPSVHGEENQYLPRYPQWYIPHLVQGSVDDDALMMSCH